MRDSAKVSCEGLHVQLAAKLFCLKTSMVYSIFMSHMVTNSLVAFSSDDDAVAFGLSRSLATVKKPTNILS